MIQTCLGTGCDYKLVISRGKPPQECNQVAFWAGRDTAILDDDCSFCESRFTMLVFVEITRICASGRDHINFNFDQEEEQALCFYRDLDLIECCIDDADKDQILADHVIDEFVRVSTEPDATMRGDAYSATITIRISGENCCDGALS